jgi:ornithine carbamoyltransferase
MKAFNDLADFSNEEIAALLELAGRLDEHPEPEALRGKVLSLLFLSPSLRTLASFQAAMTRLGGGSFVISPEMSIHGIETRPGIVMDGAAAEHIREAVPVIATQEYRTRHGRDGIRGADRPDRHALHQHGVRNGSPVPEPCGLEDDG